MEEDFVSPEMKRVYLDRRRKEIVDSLSALERNDIEFIESVGHKLKGNGQSFGFPLLTNLGSKLEEACKQNNLEEIQVILKKINAFIEKQN